MNSPFEYIKIDLRDFNSIKDLKRSLREIGADDKVAKYLFHLKDDKEITIILVDKINFEAFAYYDKNSNIQLCGNLINNIKKEKCLKFITKGEKKVFVKLSVENMSVDLILDKISLSGINSLTKVEKDYLENIK